MLSGQRLHPDDAERSSRDWFQRKRTRELALVACFLLPSLAIFFLYRLLPLGWNVLLSFQCLVAAQGRRSWIGLEHYEEMLLDDDVFWQALANTLIFIGCSPIAIAAGARHRAAGQQRPAGAPPSTAPSSSCPTR